MPKNPNFHFFSRMLVLFIVTEIVSLKPLTCSCSEVLRVDLFSNWQFVQFPSIYQKNVSSCLSEEMFPFQQQPSILSKKCF
jgi:hypothetical protein